MNGGGDPLVKDIRKNFPKVNFAFISHNSGYYLLNVAEEQGKVIIDDIFKRNGLTVTRVLYNRQEGSSVLSIYFKKESTNLYYPKTIDVYTGRFDQWGPNYTVSVGQYTSTSLSYGEKYTNTTNANGEYRSQFFLYDAIEGYPYLYQDKAMMLDVTLAEYTETTDMGDDTPPL